MLAKIYTATLVGAKGQITEAEAYISRGLPGFHIVGMTDTVIKEAIERVRAAIINSGFNFPMQRITVSLTPADKKKRGSHYDLAIAVAILAASSSKVSFNENKYAFFGELALDGKVGAVPGILPLALCAEKNGIENIVVPAENIGEVRFIKNSRIICVSNLSEAFEIVMKKDLKGFLFGDDKADFGDVEGVGNELEAVENDLDFSQVKGQEGVKRAAVIAAAGGHDMIMMGSPGVGKSMIAKRFPGILPPMTYEEKRESTEIYSVAGMLDKSLPSVENRPFRAPHSSITRVALIGGGIPIKPGEISLAHNGILFLDEMTDFDSRCLYLLRQPMEEKLVRITRNRESIVFPADFQLICAINPCKCGYLGDERHACTCTPAQLASYEERLSAPFLDRIDMHVQMASLTYDDMREDGACLDTRTMRKLAEDAREIQKERYKNESFCINGRLPSEKLEKYIKLGKGEKEFVKKAFDALGFSVRALHRILKLSRTIADVEKSSDIKDIHIAEAIQYRSFERLYRRKDIVP